MGIAFAHQHFNTLRRMQDLQRSRMPMVLRNVDRCCNNRRCLACPLLSHLNYVASKTKRTTHPVGRNLRCTTLGVVYLLECRLCGKQYVHQTAKHIREYLARHKTNFRVAPMSHYSQIVQYHHCDVFDICIILEIELRMEREWTQCLGTVIPGGLNNKSTYRYNSVSCTLCHTIFNVHVCICLL